MKVSASARINGLCISNGGGGCDGPGTSQVGARASASTTTISDPGIATPTLMQNNVTLTGAIARVASFLSTETETAYVNGTIPDAKAIFTYQISQLKFNPDAGQDVFSRLTGGSVTLTSHYDGTVSMTTTGFVAPPSSWSNSPLVFTTSAFTLQPGKAIQVTSFASVDSAFHYSLRTADVIASDLAFGSTFRYSSDALAPAFTDAAVTVPDLGIQGGVYPEPVPEPGAGGMILVGLAGLAEFARRHRAPRVH